MSDLSALDPWTGSLAAVALVSGLPLLVTLLMAQRETSIRRILPQLSAFGAGAVFAAAVGHIIPEALAAGTSMPVVALCVAAGYGLFWGIERGLAGHDHAHAHGQALGAPSAHETDRSAEECVHLHPTPANAIAHNPQGVHGADSHRSARALVPMAFLGDALHNLVDGMLIAASFLAGTSAGLLTLLAVALHELPREVGTFSLFVHGGIRPMRAVMYNLLTAVVAMAGAAITLTVGARVTAVGTVLLPVAAGTYLYIAYIVGKASLRDRHADPTHWNRLGWSGLGVAVSMGSALLA
ncbi:MAG TPA: ZIP family metal transporter [Gemmatimonas sp.]|nr:ZIP family metal transporter [Gemmatimonas sp.]